MGFSGLWFRRVALRKYGFYLRHRGVLFKGANLLLNLAERRLKRIRLWSKPFSICIDPGNFCNLRCPECITGTHHPERLKPRAMTLEEFKNVFNLVKKYVFNVSLYNWGEPFMVKDIFGMIEYATSNGVGVTIHSNMNIFDERKAEAAVRAKLTHVYCSIDGASQAVYEQYRRRGNLSTAINNVRLLLDARKRLGATHPFVTWKYLVFPHNHHEVEQARSLAMEVGVDEFVVVTGTVNLGFWEGKQFHEGVGMVPMEVPDFCESLWSSLFVNPGAVVTPCCQSFRNVDLFGNLVHEGLDTVWNGPRYLEARRLFREPLKSGRDVPYPCRDCGIVPKAQAKLGVNLLPKNVGETVSPKPITIHRGSRE